MAKQFLFCLAFCYFAAVALGQIAFSGDAQKDFENITGDRNITLLKMENDNSVSVSDWMKDHNQTSGFDLRSLNVQYSWSENILYVGFDCFVICGDADGDGDPGVSTDKGNNYTLQPNQKYSDTVLQRFYESTAMTIWTYPPADYRPNGDDYDWTGYLPDIVVGDSVTNDLTTFDAYSFGSATKCSSSGFPEDSPECASAREAMYSAPGRNFGYPIALSSQLGLYGLRPVQKVELHAYPNASKPDIEFKMFDFSNYGRFNFTPGVDEIVMGFSMFLGSSHDASGEEIQYPQILRIPCIIHDMCGVCNGNNQTCMDCAGIPNGPHDKDICDFCVLPGDEHVIDACGNCTMPGFEQVIDGCGNCVNPGDEQHRDICGFCVNFGEEHIIDECGNCTMPADAQIVDACGRCVDESDRMVIDDCHDCVYLAQWNQAKDECGVCRGNGSTCADCSGNPNGDLEIDDCKVCGGMNRDMDLCFVCFGTNSSCADCAGIPWGNTTYDECLVCGGNGSSCADCFGTPNGDADYDGCGNCNYPADFQDLDYCGVCNGGNASCVDCAGVPGHPKGPHVYDECSNCVLPENYHVIDDCGHCVLPEDYHIIDGCDHCVLPQDYQDFDYCGVCGGHNESCSDCAGVPEGPHDYDACGNCNLPENFGVVDDCGVCGGLNKDKDACEVCFGDNSTCADCEGTPHGNKTYDLCNVCGGHNDACFCWIYTNITVNAADTWISLENRTTNYGKDVDLWVSSSKQRSLFRFDDLRFAINGATEQRPEILYAKLRLFVRGVITLPYMGWKTDQQISLHNLEHNFCEDKATWECRDYDETGCCVQWRMLALYPKVKADYAFEETASYHLVDGHKGWIEFDVKDDLENWMAHSFLNSKSYLLKKSCETEWGWIKFWSCDSVGQVNCPHLEIRLRSPCQATPPVIPPPEDC